MSLEMDSHFLWPEHSSSFSRFMFGPRISASDIETTVATLYPDAVPVLFSSARAGLTAILQLLNMGRPDIVWCPPYSSHCVLESIARLATPATTAIDQAKVALIYHHWGFVHRHTGLLPHTTLIEDAVDTLFIPGTNPFALNGRFVLWSLPKVIATIWGGVVFCQNNEDARRLRAIREERYAFQTIQAVLRIAGDHSGMAAMYWHGSESQNGGLPCFALRQIKAHLNTLLHLVQQRIRLLEVIQDAGIKLPLFAGRLPSNIPVTIIEDSKKWWGIHSIFSAGYRSMNLTCDYAENSWERVAPLPVHQDISSSSLKAVFCTQFCGALL